MGRGYLQNNTYLFLYFGSHDREFHRFRLDGLWLVFLGSLLVAAAWSEKQVSSMNEAFKDVKLLQIMSSPVIAVPAGTTVEEFLTE